MMPGQGGASYHSMALTDENARWDFVPGPRELSLKADNGHFRRGQESDVETEDVGLIPGGRTSASPSKWHMQPNHSVMDGELELPSRGVSGQRGYGHAGKMASGGRGPDRGGNVGAAPPSPDDDSSTESEDEEALQAKQKAFAQRHRPPPKKRPATVGKARAGGGISVRVLIEEGLLHPGEGVLSVEYKGMCTYADLNPDGRIQCTIQSDRGVETQTFESPSAFSIFLKRLINPARKADDGWKTVKYDGRFLEFYKMELLKRRAPPGAEGDYDLDQPRAKAAKYGHHGGPATNGHLPPINSRPRRQVKPPQRLGSSIEDVHAMVAPQRYVGLPGSGEPGAQPFSVRVSIAPLLTMDFHAHLSLNEVIGVLKGTWDEERRVITVLGAYPVRELRTEDDSINVEMDPEDEHRVREAISAEPGMRVVGWYHSHPSFAAMPSLIDIFNQVTQQHAHRASGCEPYIGVIVGPYDRRLPDPRSEVAWFYVKHEPGKLPESAGEILNSGFVPMALQVETDEESMEDNSSWPISREHMHSLTKRYAGQATRAEMDELWRGPISRLDKLKASLEARMPPTWAPRAVKDFLAKLDATVRTNWSVFALQSRGNMALKAKPEEEDDPEISDLTDEAAGGASADLEDDASVPHQGRRQAWDRGDLDGSNFPNEEGDEDGSSEATN